MPRTILITGATDGLGRAVATRLAADGHTVALHGRDPERLEATLETVRDAAGHDRVRAFRADLASLTEVHGLAGEVAEDLDALHVLVNNAGIGSGEPDGRERRESRDGYELRLAVNYLATFALTVELLPKLRASAPARVVHVASLGQAPMDFDDPMLERAYDGGRAYGQSKLAQITFGMALAGRVDPAEVTVNSLHPGTYMPTKIVPGRNVDSLETGVDAVARLAVDPALDGVTGRFYDRRNEARPDGQALDPAARERLVELSLGWTGLPALGV